VLRKERERGEETSLSQQPLFFLLTPVQTALAQPLPPLPLLLLLLLLLLPQAAVPPLLLPPVATPLPLARLAAMADMAAAHLQVFAKATTASLQEVSATLLCSQAIRIRSLQQLRSCTMALLLQDLASTCSASRQCMSCQSCTGPIPTRFSASYFCRKMRLRLRLICSKSPKTCHLSRALQAFPTTRLSIFRTLRPARSQTVLIHLVSCVAHALV